MGKVAFQNVFGDFSFIAHNESKCVSLCDECNSYTLKGQKKCMNKCPSQYPYLIVEKNECVANCYTDYSLEPLF